MLQKAVKTRSDSAAQYKEAGRDDLAEKELAEIGVIERYLPAQMSDEQLREIVEKAIAEVGATSMADMGSVMKVVMPAVQGQADGKAVQHHVKDLLAGS